jgi:hypothetical protein
VWLCAGLKHKINQPTHQHTTTPTQTGVDCADKEAVASFVLEPGGFPAVTWEGAELFHFRVNLVGGARITNHASFE